MKAKVDEELCTECYLCVDVCPDVFEQSDDGPARAKVSPVPSEAEESCKDAADQCPVECISIEE